MKHILPSIFLTLSACAMSHGPVRYVPPEEAAWFKLPQEFPQKGQETLSGTLAVAIQLAMEDFIPWHASLPPGASSTEICRLQRQAYDVETAPLGEEVMLVRIFTSPGACHLELPTDTGMGATYAVDTRNWRILAMRRP